MHISAFSIDAKGKNLSAADAPARDEAKREKKAKTHPSVEKREDAWQHELWRVWTLTGRADSL